MKVSLPYVGRALTLGTLLLGLSLGAKAQDADGIVVYNAQHESLTQAWADGFTKETGIKVTHPQGQRHRARQPDRPGRRRLAGRRVPDREFAGDGAGRQGRPVRAGRRRHAGAGAGGLPAGQRPLDRHRRAHTVFAYNKTQADAQTSCRSRCSTSPIRAGRAAGPPRRRAPISRRSSARCSSSRARPRPPAWLKAMKENATRLQGQQHGDEGRQCRRDRRRA